MMPASGLCFISSQTLSGLPQTRDEIVAFHGLKRLTAIKDYLNALHQLSDGCQGEADVSS